jgi:hypothetical protein
VASLRGACSYNSSKGPLYSPTNQCGGRAFPRASLPQASRNSCKACLAGEKGGKIISRVPGTSNIFTLDHITNKSNCLGTGTALNTTHRRHNHYNNPGHLACRAPPPATLSENLQSLRAPLYHKTKACLETASNTTHHRCCTSRWLGKSLFEQKKSISVERSWLFFEVVAH